MTISIFLCLFFNISYIVYALYMYAQFWYVINVAGDQRSNEQMVFSQYSIKPEQPYLNLKIHCTFHYM